LKDKLRELDLNLLVILDVLLQTESVSVAAQQLQMSQSAVSHALKRLRDLFGDELFVRSRDGMSPTPKADEISENVREIIRLTRNTLVPAQAFDPQVSDRTISLALGNVGDMAMLPSIIQHFRKNASNIKILSLPLTAEESVPLLGTGNLDLYVGLLNSFSSDIMRQKLYEDQLVVVASNKHDYADTISLDQYTSAEHFMARPRVRSPTLTNIPDIFENSGVPRNVRIETPHIACLPGLLEYDDQLVATIPRTLAKHYKKNYQIKILEPDFELAKVEVSQYWHRRFNNDPLTLWLRRTMATLFQNTDMSF